MTDPTPTTTSDFSPQLQRAVASVRDAPVATPSFDGVLARIERRRIAGARPLMQASRWLLLAAGALFAMTALLLVVRLLDGTVWGAALEDIGSIRWNERSWSDHWLGELAELGEPLVLAVAGPALTIPAIALLFGARGMVSGRFAGGVLARAVGWSSLVVGLVIAAEFGNPYYVVTGVVVAFASGRALLLAREQGLESATAEGTAFQPVAFRGPLVVALVMAWADALTLVFSGVLQLRWLFEALTWWGTRGHLGNHWYLPFATLACGVVMIVAVVGLFRLKVWALLLNIVANLAIAAMAVNDVLGLPGTVAMVVVCTATIQLFLPIPVLATAFGDERAGQNWLHRTGHQAGYWLVRALMVAAIPAAVFSYGRVGWLEADGIETDVRGSTKFRSFPKPGDPGVRTIDGPEGQRLVPPVKSAFVRLERGPYLDLRSMRSPRAVDRWLFHGLLPELEPGESIRVGTIGLEPARLTVVQDRHAFDFRVAVEVPTRVDDPDVSLPPRRGHVVLELRNSGDETARFAFTLDDRGGWFELCPPESCGPSSTSITPVEDVVAAPAFRWDVTFPPETSPR